MKSTSRKTPSPAQLKSFVQTVWHFYEQCGRPFPWRNTIDPYKIVVSEVMLQQTQTDRVVTKYEQFIEEFSDFETLAHASLKDVLSIWQGLGYNRRGKFLCELAQRVVEEHAGQLPADPEAIVTLPGIGKATAASICAFAFNMPVVFIETNIRAVFIHSFFPGKMDVHDSDLEPLVRATLDQERPREWYYALMDYGVMLKVKFGNPCRRSKHHTVQSKFEGSDRQVRGGIIRVLTEQHCRTLKELTADLRVPAKRLRSIADGLVAEGFIMVRDAHYAIVP